MADEQSFSGVRQPLTGGCFFSGKIFKTMSSQTPSPTKSYTKPTVHPKKVAEQPNIERFLR